LVDRSVDVPELDIHSVTAIELGAASETATPIWMDDVTIRAIFDSAYSAWQAEHFTVEEIYAGNAGLAGDLDGDGMSHLLEYAFGGDPKAPDTNLIAPVVDTDANRLRIAFSCDASHDDLVYTVQTSASLASNSWVDIAKSIAGDKAAQIGELSLVSDSGSGVRTVTVTDQETLSPSSKKYIRVKVSRE
jgi:hypothetical protein